MKLICSGEVYPDPIEVETCLKCAKEKVAPPCGYSYPLIKAMTHQEERTGIHVTAVIGCLLRSFYDLVDEEPKFLHDHLALWLGRSTHSDIENVLVDDEVKTEVQVTYEGIEGRIDVIQGEDIIDFKTTGYLDPYRLPYGSHRTQVALYQRMAGLDGKLYIQYISMTGPSKCKKCKQTMQLLNGRVQCPQCGAGNSNSHLGAKMIEIDPENTDEYIARAKVLKEAVETNVPPVGEPSWLCYYCSHINKCPLGQIYKEAE